MGGACHTGIRGEAKEKRRESNHKGTKAQIESIPNDADNVVGDLSFDFFVSWCLCGIT